MMDTTENGTALARRNEGGAAVAKRDNLGNAELMRTGETAAVAQAHQAEALVRARFALAISRPRVMAVVRERALDECQRPRFAQVARYRVPRGGSTIEGWSIRAAEALGRIFGNIDVNVSVIADDPARRVLQVTAIDLESNFTTGAPVTVAKVMERRQLRNGQVAIASRTNSEGQLVHLVEATDDELLVKQNALLSKARRNAILQLIPGDLLDEMLEVVNETRRKGDKAEDPEAYRKRMLDGFYEIGVKASMLAEYIRLRFDKTVETLTVDEMHDLRDLHTALRDKEVTWKDAMAGLIPDAEVVDPPKSAGAPPKTTADLKRAEKAKKGDSDNAPEPGSSG
jgi:hypothetical protein